MRGAGKRAFLLDAGVDGDLLPGQGPRSRSRVGVSDELHFEQGKDNRTQEEMSVILSNSGALAVVRA